MSSSFSVSRRAALGLLAAGAVAGATGCSTESVLTGERLNSPTTTHLPTTNPVTDPATLSISLESLPSYTPAQYLGKGTYQRSITDAPGEFWWRIYDQNNKVIEKYEPVEQVAWGDPDTYARIKGVLTFRGNHYRNGGAFGSRNVADRKLEIKWTKDIGEIRGEGSYWPGAGWTGQPLLVNWTAPVRTAMGFPAEFDHNDFVEVLYPVFDGHIYRLDLRTGKETKPAINARFGFKGTASVDPRGYPLLYAGQGLNDRNGTIGYWRYRVFDLIHNKEIWHIPGIDPSAMRLDWGAFDSSALINPETDTLIEPAENGLIYKVKLNTSFDAKAKRVSIKPELVKMAYSGASSHKHGVESSAVAYRNLMFAADNDGNVFCWDATTMQIIWMRNTGDDVDASLALDVEGDGKVYLYTGNEVDTRGGNGGERICNLRKIDALSGKQIWQYDIPAYYDTAVNGGLLGSPAIGQGALGDLVFFNVARTTAPREGDLLALDKKTGAVVYRRHLSNYSWSSPVLFQSNIGDWYGVLPDSDGVVHLFDPHTGKDISTVKLGKNTESTIAIYDDMMVVASYDKKIYGIQIQ